MKKYMFFLLLSISCLAQKEVVSKSTADTLFFNFNRIVYSDIAKDSILKIYNDQYIYFSRNSNNPDKDQSISSNYKFEDLRLYSIPKFRIRKSASEQYDCKNTIEQFIEFEEIYKYQDVLIYDKKDSVICVVDIPNFNYEIGRIMNPDLSTDYSKLDYQWEVLEHFLSFPNAYNNKRIKNIIAERPKNFFFTVFGIESCIFEIDNNTKLLYLNYLGTNRKWDKRALANDFIRSNIGENIIKKYALSQYDMGSRNYKGCKCSAYSNKNILIKVNQIN